MNQNSIAEQLRVAALQWQDALEQGFREEGKVVPRINKVIYSIQSATVTMESPASRPARGDAEIHRDLLQKAESSEKPSQPEIGERTFV